MVKLTQTVHRQLPFFRNVPFLFPLQTTKQLSETLSLIVTNSKESNITRDLM